jgi:hypothetical protein
MRNGVLAVAVSALMLGMSACGDAGSDADTGDATAAVDTMADRANAVAEVDLATFTADPESHVGHEVRLANVSVDSRMGERGFWLKLSNQGLYLVRGTAENATSVQPGQRVTVAGPIREMTDSVVQAWIAEGAITADQEMEARYASSFMDAWYVSSGQQAAAGAAQE